MSKATLTWGKLRRAGDDVKAAFIAEHLNQLSTTRGGGSITINRTKHYIPSSRERAEIYIDRRREIIANHQAALARAKAKRAGQGKRPPGYYSKAARASRAGGNPESAHARGVALAARFGRPRGSRRIGYGPGFVNVMRQGPEYGAASSSRPVPGGGRFTPGY